MQAQSKAQSAPGTFTAKTDFRRGIALAQQIIIGGNRILQRRRKGVLRGQAVSPAEDLGPAFVCQHRAEAQGVIKASAGVAAAVKVEHHPVPAQVLGQDPGPPECLKVMAFHPHLGMAGGPHQLSDGVLPFPSGFQGAIFQHGLHMGQLFPNCIC